MLFVLEIGWTVQSRFVMKMKSDLLKSTFVYAVGNFGAKVLAYVMVVVYSYYITPSELGYYDLILTTVAMIQPLIMFQINDSVFRYSIIADDKTRSIILGTSFKFLLIMVVFAETIFLAISSLITFRFTLWISLYMISFIIYSYMQDAIRGTGKNKYYAVFGLLNSFVMLVCEVIGLVLLKLGVEALLISKVASNIICLVWIYFVLPEIRQTISKHFDGVLLREMLIYSTPLVPNTICWWVMSASDRYVILSFLGASANGLYSYANKFPMVITTISGIFYLAWQETAIAKYNTADRDSYYSQIFTKYYLLLFSLVACAAPATKLFTTMLVADEYRDVWRYTGFLYFGASFCALSSFLGLGYQISKETKKSLISTVVSAMLNILANMILISKIGLQAASISTFLAYLFLYLIRIKHTKRYFNLYYSKVIFVTAVIVGVISNVMTAIINETFLLCGLEGLMLLFLFYVLNMVRKN